MDIIHPKSKALLIWYEWNADIATWWDFIGYLMAARQPNANHSHCTERAEGKALFSKRTYFDPRPSPYTHTHTHAQTEVWKKNVQLGVANSCTFFSHIAASTTAALCAKL